MRCWMFHVKRGADTGAPFHVKHSVNRLNERILLSYTELAEDDIEDVFNIDPTEQPAKGVRCGPEFFGGEFLALADHGDRPAQRICRVLDEHPLPLPCDQASFAAAKIVLRETHQGLDQFGETGAVPGGNPELGHWPTLGIDR